jgi:hypothetical protein
LEKTCSKCKKTLPIEGFYRNRLLKDGRFNICKSCMRKRMVEYRANIPTKEKPSRKYTEEEMEFIRENYGKIKTLEIAKKLNRTCSAIKQVALRNGLIKRRKNTTIKPRTVNKVKHEHSDVCSMFFSIINNVYKEHGKEIGVEGIIAGTMAFFRNNNGGQTWMP